MHNCKSCWLGIEENDDLYIRINHTSIIIWVVSIIYFNPHWACLACSKALSRAIDLRALMYRYDPWKRQNWFLIFEDIDIDQKWRLYFYIKFHDHNSILLADELFFDCWFKLSSNLKHLSSGYKMQNSSSIKGTKCDL